MTVAAFSVRQTVLVNVLFFVCLLAGWTAFLRIPVEFFPDINLNEINITTVWSGASAEEVERLVTQKLEEELGEISNVREMRSESQANLSQIVIEFDEYLNDVEYESAVNDVRAAIDRVPDLPEDAEEPLLTEIILGETTPVVVLAVVDGVGIGDTALREIALEVQTRVERLPGVNRAEIRGDLDREIRVLVDRDAAARYGLTPVEVAERIRRRNLNLPAGTFGVGGGEATLRARGDYQSPDEILQTVVRDEQGGALVRLGEIARLEEGLEKRRFVNRFNGKPAQMVTLTKQSDADVIDLVAAVDAWIVEIQPQLPEGVTIRKTLDTADFVESRMGVLRDNLQTGILLVAAILWFTIGFRNAMLTIIAIPFSFLTAMIFFPLFNITINSTTLIGMLLVSGMLVDDAIIVLENIYRRVETGEPLRDAVVNGTNEVMWPVIAAVATTCAAFAPLLLIGGVAGKFVSILPKAVVLCLIASLFECLVVLPAHYLHLGSRRHEPDDAVPQSTTGWRALLAWIPALAARIRGAVDGGLAGLRSTYERSLGPVLQHRVAFSVLLASLLFLALGVSRHLHVNLFPGEFSTFNIALETPPEYSLDQTDALVQRIESQIETFRGDSVSDYSTTVGLSVAANYDRLSGNNLSLSFLEVSDEYEGGDGPERVLIGVKDHMEEWADGNGAGIVELRVQAEQDGPPIGPPVEVRLLGDDWAVGKAIASEMTTYLESLPGVFNVEDNLKLGPAEVRLAVDGERASRHGVRFEDLAMALRAANDGVVASSYRDPARGEDIDIRVLLEASQRRGLSDLLEAEIRTHSGSLIKLRDVAQVEVTRGFRSYRHYDGSRSVNVYANIDEAVTSSIAVNQQLQARFADVELRFPEVEVRYGGEYEESNKSFERLGRIFWVAFVAIYMILAALFRSYIQPFVVLAAIPFGLAGVITGVALMGYDISFVLMYATIGLTGVVVNDSLVMVDFINRARREGMDLLEAVRLSGARRFRPILLTTLTTVLALLPMALGLSGESRSYGPFAAAISFGLILAMAGTLYAVPLAYTSLAVLRERAGRVWTKWVGSGAGRDSAAELEAHWREVR